jgi:hypothetical protein
MASRLLADQQSAGTLRFALLTTTIAVVACGGTVVETAAGTTGTGATTTGIGAGAGTTSGQNGTSTGTSATASSSGQGTGGSSSGYGCPASAPVAGTSCADVLGPCTYGDAIVATCRQSFVCQTGTWLSTSTPCSPQPPSCPATEPQEQSTCDADAGASQCAYPNGSICTCSPCGLVGPVCMPGPPAWYCESPNPTPGCPTLIPNEGTSCGAVGLACAYPDEGCGMAARCIAAGSSNAWTWEPQPCPP